MRMVRDNLAALGVNEWATNKRIDVGAPFSGSHSFIRFIFVDRFGIKGNDETD